jgi:chorismate mutase
MGNDPLQRMKLLGERLRRVDKSLSRLTAERLSILAGIARLDAERGASERQTASRVANLISSTPKLAANELALAKQVSSLPGVADAHRNGEISNGQLGDVAAIASASSEAEALDLAKTATSAQLARQAATSRGKLFEQRRQAQKSRYLAFKPEEDGQSMRFHGRLGFEDGRQLELQLRKIADRLGLCDKERPSPSARMADALLILTKYNPSSAFHANQEQTVAGNSASSQKYGPAPAKPKLYIPQARPANPTNEVVDYEVDPFPAPEDRDPWDVDEEAEDQTYQSSYEPTRSNSAGPTPSPGQAVLLTDRQAGSDAPAQTGSPAASQDTTGSTYTNDREVVVQKAVTRLIIHWNAATGSVNFENGPPVDHPRLQAILCDAQIDIQHCDHNGLPTGLVTTARHANYRQERYLAYRDGVCRVPECEGIGKTQAHHIFEDRADRITSVEFMINLCNRHHTEHHDGIFTIAGRPESTIIFTHNDGTVLTSTAKPPSLFKRPKPTSFRKHPDPAPSHDEFPMSAYEEVVHDCA